MTEEPDNPLERILDEVILDPGKEGESRPPDAQPPPEDTARAEESSTGNTSRAHRFLDDDAAIMDILQDMAKLSHEDQDKLDFARSRSGEYKSLDQVARETGIISFEQQDAVFRTYLEHRVDELKEKLVGAQIGRYSIIDELGRGGMGIVFKARQESPMFTREVALKFMLAGPESETHDRERFISEVKGLAGLSHPFLVPIFDSGIEADLYYFSMEFIDGSPLSDSSVTDDLPIEKKVEIVRDIARALDYLHEQGVIHRDVKPGNIMLDRHGNAMLLDFGIAQFSADPRRRVAQAGTPFYMAPEVIAPGGDYGPIGPRTDIYALGAVLYKLLTGQEVFPYEDDVTEVFRKTLKAEPSFSTTRKRIVHPDLERVMRRCLRKQVDERYASAGKMADELDKFLKRTRFKLWHVVGAVAIVVLSAFAVVDTFREEPTPSPLPPTAQELAEEAVKAAETKVRQLGVDLAIETFDLPRDVEEWLLPALKGLDQLASDAGRPGGYKRFENAFATFHTDAASLLKKKAGEMWDSLISIVKAKNPSFKEGSVAFFDADKNVATTYALQMYLLAIERFARAEKETKDAQQLQKQRDEATSARNSAEYAKRFLKDDDLSAISTQAHELFTEGEDAWIKADRYRASNKHEQARDAFRRAETRYDKARTTFSDDRTRFVEDKRNLRDETKLFLVEFNGKLELYLVNVREKWKTGLETIKQESQSAFTDIDAAKSRVEFDGLKARLDRWRTEFIAAKAEFEHARDKAADDQMVAEAFLAHPDLERLPKTCRELIGEAKQHLSTAREAFAKQEYRGATDAYVAFRSAGRSIEDKREELTHGMSWIDGGKIDGVHVSGFWVDRTRVSVTSCDEYLGENSDAKEPFNWIQQLKSLDAPVVGVSFELALDFADEHGKSLPNLAQAKLASGRAPELFGVADSSDSQPSEWVRPILDGDEGLLVDYYVNDHMEDRDILDDTRETLTAFRCIVEAVSWDGEDAR